MPIDQPAPDGPRGPQPSSAPDRGPPLRGPARHAPYPTQLVRPRRVRDGIKVATPDPTFAAHWAARRWIDHAAGAAPADVMSEGLSYARLGQTRSLQIDPGAVRAVVQGRADRPYTTVLAVPVLPADAWDRLIRAMGEQARYAARLLAGELSPEIDELARSLGLSIFPDGDSPVGPACTCTDAARGWCKHACCVAYLIGERLTVEPLILLTLRGAVPSELVERLREQRAALATSEAPAPVFSPIIPGVSDRPSRPLAECVERFWEGEGDPADLDTTIEPPEVSHPLLRRLGPSPFPGGGFPLIGLLATCYEVATARVLAEVEQTSSGGAPADAADEQSTAARHGADDGSSATSPRV